LFSVPKKRSAIEKELLKTDRTGFYTELKKVNQARKIPAKKRNYTAKPLSQLLGKTKLREERFSRIDR
jgi:hypothetical protein